jgi:hypothetical protein
MVAPPGIRKAGQRGERHCRGVRGAPGNGPEPPGMPALAAYYREHPIVDTIGRGSGLPSPESRTFTAGILPSVHSMPAALSASYLRLPPTPAAGAWATPHGCISVASQVERAPGSMSSPSAPSPLRKCHWPGYSSWGLSRSNVAIGRAGTIGGSIPIRGTTSVPRGGLTKCGTHVHFLP